MFRLHKTGLTEAASGNEALSVWNVIAKFELNVGLLKVRDALGNYVWEVKEHCLVGNWDTIDTK